jgi:DNA-binding XRE family transcriptional regulator
VVLPRKLTEPSDLVAAMIERCGDTPLKTRTPSGGVHLWYRHSGERSVNLRDLEGIPVDVKGRGASLIVVPPSVRPSGLHEGKAYEFIAGSWDNLPDLPKIRTGALPTEDTNSAGGRANGRAANADVVNLRTVKKGHRGDMLLKLALREAPCCDDEAALLDAMRTVVGNSFEDNPEDPFTDTEIRKTVARAWKYQVQGDNWAGTEAKVYVTNTERGVLTDHKHGSDSALLLMTLRFAHWDRDHFAASPDAMAKAQIIPRWAHGRYRTALLALTETGILRVVHEGGRGPRDPRLFAFAAPVMIKGMGTGHNLTKHPLPSCRAARPSATPSTAADTDPHLTDTLSNPVGVTSTGGDIPSVAVVGGDGQLDLIEFIGGPPAPRRAANPHAFGAALREARTRLHLTQKTAARMAGMSRSGFGNIETGEYPPSPKTVARLAEVFGVRLT